MNLKSTTQIPVKQSICGYVGHSLGIAIAVICFLLLSAARSEASYKTVIGGITVSYSGYAVAYYDSYDDTLTVEIDSSGGSLNISVGSTATNSWGGYVDVFIDAGGVVMKSMSIKGSPACTPYVCGNIYYVDKFSMSLGVIGGTDTYGRDVGLGMTSTYIPTAVSMKYSYALAQIFGYANTY